MNKEELKSILIHKISEIDDEILLERISVMLDQYSLSYSQYEISAGQAQKIISGLSQLELGQVISNEDLEKEEDKWLKE